MNPTLTGQNGAEREKEVQVNRYDNRPTPLCVLVHSHLPHRPVAVVDVQEIHFVRRVVAGGVLFAFQTPPTNNQTTLMVSAVEFRQRISPTFIRRSLGIIQPTLP